MDETKQTAVAGRGDLPEWTDPILQEVYAVLCSEDTPPAGEHWEGFAAKRIVALVRAAERERCARLCERLRDEHCAATHKSWDANDWCEPDGFACDLVVAWNRAASTIRGA